MTLAKNSADRISCDNLVRNGGETSLSAYCCSRYSFWGVVSSEIKINLMFLFFDDDNDDDAFLPYHTCVIYAGKHLEHKQEKASSMVCPAKSSWSRCLRRASCRAQIQLISIERLSFCASGIDVDSQRLIHSVRSPLEDATNRHNARARPSAYKSRHGGSACATLWRDMWLVARIEVLLRHCFGSASVSLAMHPTEIYVTLLAKQQNPEKKAFPSQASVCVCVDFRVTHLGHGMRDWPAAALIERSSGRLMG